MRRAVAVTTLITLAVLLAFSGFGAIAATGAAAIASASASASPQRLVQDGTITVTLLYPPPPATGHSIRCRAAPGLSYSELIAATRGCVAIVNQIAREDLK